MRETLESLLILAVFCFSASAQTPQACQAQLRHLAMPAYGVTKFASGRAPLEFLFSQDGVDVYSATFSVPNYPNWISDHGMSVILVYQDEAARQREIAWLRERPFVRGNSGDGRITQFREPSRTLDSSGGSRPSLDNLKFAVLHFGLRTVAVSGNGTLADKKWLLEEADYYVPQVCVPTPKPNYSQPETINASDLDASLSAPNWITRLNVPAYRMRGGDNDPLLVKTIQAMQAKVKELAGAGPEPSPLDVYAPCVEATQHVQVPEDVHLPLPGQVPPEQHVKFFFMFSQDGIDVYGIGSERYSPNSSSPVLFVFQDEKTRREYLTSFIGTTAVAWDYFKTSLGRQDWKPIVSLKYATFNFSWLTVGTPPKSQPILVHAVFYAPLDCYSQTTFAGTLPSSEIGVYTNMAAGLLDPRNAVLYRAATELSKMQNAAKTH